LLQISFASQPSKPRLPTPLFFYVTAPLRHRVVWAEIDREARKGKPLPSDHAPLVIDIDSPGHPFDAGWASADSRIAARLQKQP
jgi:hypothetical protein